MTAPKQETGRLKRLIIRAFEPPVAIHTPGRSPVETLTVHVRDADDREDLLNQAWEKARDYFAPDADAEVFQRESGFGFLSIDRVSVSRGGSGELYGFVAFAAPLSRPTATPGE